MKVRRQLAELEPLVIQPLHGVKDEQWHEAPPGKWSVAQLVAHLAKAVDASACALEKRADRKDLIRRANPGQAIARHLLLGLGKFPGGLDTPAKVAPEARPDPELVTAEFRVGVEKFAGFLEWPGDRQLEVFVAHPFLGDLNVPEWVRFHYVHSKHHAGHIRERLKWLDQTGKTG